jgi:hypothetical protein
VSPAPAAALAANPRGLPPAVVPFPVAPAYRVRADLVPLGRAPEHVDDPGPATLVRLDDGAPAALDHALRELEEAADAVRWADPGAGEERWWGIANAVSHALAADGDPRVGPAAGEVAFGEEGVGATPTTAGLAFPWLGLRVTRAGALERTAPAPDAPRELAARAPRAADALARLPGATRALDALRLAIAEDLVVLLRDRRGAGGRAAYLFVAAPSGWDPGARGNADLAELHAPVPHGGPLRAAGAAIADAMVDKGPFVRHVWSLATDDAPSHHPRRHPATPLGGRDPATWWLRVERQTTLPLPSLGASAFFIRVLHQPLARAVAGPGRRARLASAVRSMDAALRAYKGLAGSADALLAWLERPDPAT